MNEEQLKQEFEQIRHSAMMTSVNILSLRIALVEKKVVTEEELANYDKIAQDTIQTLMTSERGKLEETLKEMYGEEEFASIKAELDKTLPVA